MISEYEKGKLEVLQQIVAKIKELDDAECPDCEGENEPQYTECDITCMSINHLNSVIRACGYAMKLDGELVKG